MTDVGLHVIGVTVEAVRENPIVVLEALRRLSGGEVRVTECRDAPADHAGDEHCLVHFLGHVDPEG